MAPWPDYGATGESSRPEALDKLRSTRPWPWSPSPDAPEPAEEHPTPVRFPAPVDPPTALAWPSDPLPAPIEAGEPVRSDDDDPLMWFPAEADKPGTGRSRRLLLWGLAAAVVVVAAVGVAVGVRGRSLTTAPTANGTLVLESEPAGALVTVDGRSSGLTPVTLSLAAGSHLIVLERDGTRREIRRTVEPGDRIIEHVDLPPAALTGALRVVTRPPGAAVSVDGVRRGVSPIEIADLRVGGHTVSLTSGQTTVDETVTVVAGVTSSLVVPIGGSGVGYGWLSVRGAVPLQVFEAGKLVGTSETDQIMMVAGSHSLELVNAALGFKASRTVDVSSGQVARVEVPMPNGTLSVNAVPWAEVFLDGERIGETPIANLAVPIGPHELEFRNPQFGTQRRTVTVALGAPTRVGVDLRRQ